MRTAILASTIRVMNQTVGRMLCRDCPEERPLDQVFGNPRSQGVADDLAIKEVLVSSAVEPALFRGM